MKANVLTLRDQIDDAVAAYEAIIKQYPRTEHSAEAYYQMGVIDYHTHRNSESGDGEPQGGSPRTGWDNRGRTGWRYGKDPLPPQQSP